MKPEKPAPRSAFASEKGPYGDFEGINSQSIKERTRLFKAVCVEAMKKGLSTPESLLDLIPDEIEYQHYEFVAGIEKAVEEFDKNPQLSLF